MRRRFDFTGLEDKDVIACYLLANTEEGGKVNEIEFQRLLDQRRGQVREEIIQLSQDLEKLEISKGIPKEDFELQGRIYLTAQEHGCTMIEAAEIITKLDMERTAKPTGDYAKIIKALEVPKYGSPKDDIVKTEEEGQKEEPQGEVEWVQAGTVKLQSLKRKYRR